MGPEYQAKIESLWQVGWVRLAAGRGGARCSCAARAPEGNPLWLHSCLRGLAAPLSSSISHNHSCPPTHPHLIHPPPHTEQKYESKKEEEAALLQKSQQILESLAESEAAERQQLVEAMAAASAAAAPAPAQRQQEQGALQALFARIAALFQALQRWVQQLVSSLTGGSGSGAGASA